MKSTFRTVLEAEASAFQINHETGIFCMGSCFAEHIGKRLEAFKFPVCLNPFGIIYNPISIAEGLNFLLGDSFFEEKDLVENLGGWHSFQHHGSFSHAEKEVVLEKINKTITAARSVLGNAEYLILTLGTSNVFVEKNTNKIVANCHKFPQQHFSKKKLEIDEMVNALGNVIGKIKDNFPKIKIITTVSPVRHIRDGLVENQISKSKLILTLHKISQQYNYVKYFPAYELLLDDLRDYRFFKKDLIHPSEMAVDYIWNFFEKTFFSQKTNSINSRIEKLKLAAAHRPFHPQSAAHLDFIKNQLEKIKEIENEYSFLNFGAERAKLKGEK